MLSTVWTPIAGFFSHNWISLVGAVVFVIAYSAIDEYRLSRARKARSAAAKAREDAQWWEEMNRLRYMGLLSNEGEK